MNMGIKEAMGCLAASGMAEVGAVAMGLTGGNTEKALLVGLAGIVPAAMALRALGQQEENLVSRQT
jgi:hypothetical protein